jgi:hypothetical protein
MSSHFSEVWASIFGEKSVETHSFALKSTKNTKTPNIFFRKVSHVIISLLSCKLD